MPAPAASLDDKAIKDLERGRYEVARLTLQTLMNTYDTSEYLAKAKLAIADSYYDEGTSSSLTQAIAEQLKARTVIGLAAPSWADSARQLADYFEHVLRENTLPAGQKSIDSD